MRVAKNSHALPLYKKYRLASLLCIFKTIIAAYLMVNNRIFFIISQSGDSNEHHKLKFYEELTNYVFWLS